MSSKLLRSALICRRYSLLMRGFPFQSSVQSYAIRTAKPNFIQMTMKESKGPHFSKMLYTTQVAPKEYIPNADSLLSNVFSHYKTAGYVRNEQVQKLITNLENEDHSPELLTKENIHFLLHACGTEMPSHSVEERMELFQRIWDFLKKRKLLTKDIYLIKLQVLQHNQIPLDDLQSFLTEIAEVCNETSETVQTPELLSELLKLGCSNGNMRNAMDVLALMRERNFALTEQNFNDLIMGHGRNHDLKEIQTTVDSMEAAGMVLSSETQATLFIAFTENKEKVKSMEILQKYQGQFSEQQILKMLRTGIRTELDDEVIEMLIRGLPAASTTAPDLSFELRQLCNEFLHSGKFDMTKVIFSALPKPSFGEKQSIDTYAASILVELFRANVPAEEIINFAETLINSEKNTRALHIVTECALRRNPPSALVFLTALSKLEALRPHYFWPLLMYNSRRHGEIGIITTLRHMKRLNVACDHETLLIYVLPQMSVTLDNPIQGVKMLIDAGVKSSILLTPVLRHLLGQRRLREPIQLLELYPFKVDVIEQLMPALQQLSIHARATKRFFQFSKLLNELTKHMENPKSDLVGQLLIYMITKQERLQQDLNSFYRLLTDMTRIGIRISPAAISTIESTLNSLASESETKVDDELMTNIQQTLQQMKNRNLVLEENAASGANSSSSFIKHPRDMSLKDLECHLIELESKGMNTRGVLRRLLQLYVRDNCLERALETKNKCDKLRVQESPGMVASIFDMYIKLGDLPKAKETLTKLQKTYPGFHLDEHKFIDYCALLVRENQLEKSLELLAERSAKQRISGGDYVIKNVWNFLTSVAQYAAKQEPKLPAEKNLTREAFEFLRKRGYCNTHNAVLGPIVREYLLRGDIKSAIGEFSKLAEKYKHTPLQFELLSILVRLCNGSPEEISQYSVTSEEAQKLLNEITTIISNIHGPNNMNSALVLAFAESGTDNQLRRLLMNPEFEINHELLQRNCEHMGKEGSVRTLLRLAKGARGLNRSVNEQTIYELLLNNFVKSNDCTAALELFERLDADDNLKISPIFVKNLVNLLRVNNLEVPSNVALKAYINKVKI